VGSGETEIWRLPNGGLNKPRDCPQLPASSYRPAVTGQQLPARNPTTENTETTEREPASFRGFRVFRGLKAITPSEPG